MQKGLISIITPCYNTGAIVHRLLDSILAQDYPSVEMWVVDDGSKDNTREVIESYVPKFDDRQGYSLKYVFQENQGQSVAINNALKLVSGEYLTWPDSDDFYSDNKALSKFVNALQKSSNDFAMVRCLPNYIDEHTLKPIAKDIRIEQYKEVNQFLNCLYSRNFVWAPGNYMIKLQAFDEVNPQRVIYTEKNAGQNWQMLMPLLYSYNCLSLDESVHNVLVRAASHSRGQYKSYEGLSGRIRSYENTIIATLQSISSMPINEKKKFIDEIKLKYAREHFFLAVRYQKKKEKCFYKKQIKDYGGNVYSIEIMKVVFYNSKFYNFLRKTKHFFHD